jgi:hypothetical protein
MMPPALITPMFGPGSRADRIVLGADWVEAANVITDVPGLEYATVAGGVYLVQVFGFFSCNAVTTGLQWRIDSTGATGAIECRSPSSSTAMVNRNEGVNAGTLAAGTGTGGVDGNPFWGWALIVATGNAIKVRARSEIAVALGVTVKAGTVMFVERVR